MIYSLAQLDFTVIALALRDSIASVTHRGRLASWIFGARSDQLPLANPKLEALRTYVVLRRQRGDRLTPHEQIPLCNAGYTLLDLCAIDHLIDHSSAAHR